MPGLFVSPNSLTFYGGGKNYVCIPWIEVHPSFRRKGSQPQLQTAESNGLDKAVQTQFLPQLKEEMQLLYR